MRDLNRRDFVAGCGLAAACAIAPKALAADALSAIDPELRPAVANWISQRAAGPHLSLATLPQVRAAGLRNLPAPLPDVPWSQRRIPVPATGGEVTLYLINAVPGASSPAILHTHGGGFIGGSPRSDLPRLQELARDLNITIASVDYDLAPEALYSRSIEQTYAGLAWTHDHATDIGVDRQRIAVLGGSAGGGHAAILAIMARDRGQVPLCGQCLIYPMLDDRTGTTRHPHAPIGQLIWTEEDNRLGWSSFLGQTPGSASVPPMAVPARCPDPKGLPPTFIGVGSVDLFVDEDIEYGQRLIDAGVPTQLLVVPGAYHGFDEIVPQAQISTRFVKAIKDFLRQSFMIP